MITEEEKEEIINIVCEKVFLAIPEVIGNLMTQQSIMHKMNTKFYEEHKEFVKHKKIVASVMEEFEGKNPLVPYEEIIKMSIPEIRKRISIVGDLDMTSVDKSPNRNFSNGEI